MLEEALINILQDNGDVIITGGGTLTLYNAEKFSEELKQASQSASSVVVDLRPADFIDTQIVQDLGKAATGMLSRGKRLRVLIAGDRYPLRVLEISGFRSIMDIEVQ